MARLDTPRQSTSPSQKQNQLKSLVKARVENDTPTQALQVTFSYLLITAVYLKIYVAIPTPMQMALTLKHFSVNSYVLHPVLHHAIAG